ncbi:hypothetical protein MY04_2002 [Flammeovirga sp. MY04]|uniref:hypothetical protein n=1 Tax=Flammeovirga sp. MY04 TaxID=1191459 RepID=UPI0008060AB3|nr:hypothetical protein [Flammeovirga sp. MY04]ANQ49376.1 hypothetical protein MY04_2002 [Flammeovirga sp. MY04]
MENSLKSLASELLTLEVNTIFKENTTGAKMPVNKRVALRDIIERYRKVLLEYDVAVKAPIASPQTDKNGFEKTVLQCTGAGEYSFIEVKHAAVKGKNYYEGLQSKMQSDEELEFLKNRIQMLYRIERQSSGMIGLFKNQRLKYASEIKSRKEGFAEEFDKGGVNDALNPFPSQMKSHAWNNDITLQEMNTVPNLELDTDQITAIRKAWELGTQQVLLQTVVQIDGDVTSYLTPKFVHLPPELRNMVMNFHQSSTNEATAHWSSLFKVLADLTGQAFSSLFGKK